MNIVAYVADNPRAALSEIRQCFQLTTSKATVKRRLAEAGVKSRMAAQEPLLTNVNKSKCLSFAQRHEACSADDWGRVVFSDECTFTTKWDQSARVWRPDRTRLHGKFADDLWAAVNEEWERLKCDSSFTEALYRSLPERMKAVVDAEGDVSRY
ncbi:hypothetical protein HPB49_009954 [Dermacentor silvarum]|uniref:Uncharacterized protein n=1 Tax=Dermacentor silvarum TaxID=543639 RepID=A0ACB8DYI6_DERSI|nr:hypothetical protein HPB49_009954 [Dermacentor silvarum]